MILVVAEHVVYPIRADKHPVARMIDHVAAVECVWRIGKHIVAAHREFLVGIAGVFADAASRPDSIAFREIPCGVVGLTLLVVGTCVISEIAVGFVDYDISGVVHYDISEFGRTHVAEIID